MNKLDFFIKDYCLIKPDDEIDLSFLSPIVRRKLSTLDKLAVSAMNKVFTPEVEEIVFASKTGEIDRLNKIIDQYQELDEVSPAQFSASVHNYPVGFFTLYKKLNTPYYALSAGDETFKSGLVKSVLSKKENVLFVYADEFAFACIVSKKQGKILKNLKEISDFWSFFESLEKKNQ